MKLTEALSESNLGLRVAVAIVALLIAGLVFFAAEQRDDEAAARPEVNQSQELRVYPL